jgi:hypothetical protein
MMARIPDSRYQAEADEFARAHRFSPAIDWLAEWKAWCHELLVGRRAPAGQVIEVSLDLFS